MEKKLGRWKRSNNLSLIKRREQTIKHIPLMCTFCRFTSLTSGSGSVWLLFSDLEWRREAEITVSIANPAVFKAQMQFPPPMVTLSHLFTSQFTDPSFPFGWTTQRHLFHAISTISNGLLIWARQLTPFLCFLFAFMNSSFNFFNFVH